MTFPPLVASVREARSFVSAVLRDWGVRSDASLLVATELASNAVVHAGTEFTVLVRRRAGGIGIEVSDHDSTLPAPLERLATAEAGRGLQIVGGLARKWGVTRSGTGGKTVWGELAGELSNDPVSAPGQVRRPAG